MNFNTLQPKSQMDTVLEKIPLILAFLMPVFFLPTTLEFFEFNKLVLLTVTTLVMTTIWITKIIQQKKIGAVKSIMDLPLLAVTVVTILATVFSINKDTSIFGSQGRWFPSLYASLVFYGFYYVITSNIKTTSAVKNGLYSLLAGITVSSIVGVLSYFEVYVGNAVFLRTPGFSLTGSITSTVVLSALGTLLAINLLLNEKSIAKKPLLLVAAIVNYILVLAYNELGAWIVFGLGLVSTLLFTKASNIKESKFFVSIGMGVILALTAVFVLPNTKDLVRNENFPKEITLPLRASWLVASSVVQDYPPLATGPSTFYMNFPRYRPVYLNNTNIWNVRFDKSANEVFNIMATTGIVGLVAVLFLAIKSTKLALVTARMKNDSEGLASTLGVLLLAASSVYLVTYATVLNTFVIMLTLAYAIVYHSAIKNAHVAEKIDLSLSTIASVTTIGESEAIKKEYLHYVLVTPLIALVLYTGWITYKVYAAEVYMRASVIAAQAGDGGKTYTYQTKAISINPQRDAYRNAYIQTNLVLANTLATKENLTEEDKQTIRQLIAQAITNSRATTEMLNPLNVTNWETRANTYRSIQGVADNASEWAVNAYNTAIQLSSTDPRLRLDLGGMYFAAGDYLTAANSFRQAVLLKQDYANAHYNFAQALIKLEDYENARKELEITKALVGEGTEDYKAVEAEISKLPQATSAAKPTVEELESIVSDNNQPKTQEPLTPAAQTQPALDKANLQVETGKPEQSTAPTQQQPSTIDTKQNN